MRYNQSLLNNQRPLGHYFKQITGNYTAPFAAFAVYIHTLAFIIGILGAGPDT